MMFFAYSVIAIALSLCLYTYLGYPLILTALRRSRRARVPQTSPSRTWPRISIAIPVFNEAGVIANTLEQILALRNRHFLAKRAWVSTRHARERARHAAWRSGCAE